MKRSMSILATAALACVAVVAVLFTVTGLSRPSRAASPDSVPTVSQVHPSTASNDMDTTVVITGTGFVEVPTVTLGSTQLDEVGWVSTTRLTATVPWGMFTGTYSLTVTNPGGDAASLADAFTVTQGMGVWTSGGPYGGDIRDMYKKPGTPDTVYALVRNVGLFVSENAGGSWRLIYAGDDWATGQESFVFDADDPDVIYLGSSFARTMDGGETWERLFVFPDIPGGRPCNHTFPVTHPSTGQIVYAGIGCFNSNPGPGEAGVFLSDDYGGTWITKTNGITDTNIWALAIHPNAPQTMLAGTRNGRLYTSLDGGDSWTLSECITGSVARVYFNPYEPLEAWASSATYDAAYLMRSTDLSNWELVSANGNGGDDGAQWDLNFLSDTIWAAYSQVYTSTDNGDHWNLIDGLGGNAIEVTADNPPEIYAASGIGIRKSNDGGASWQDSNKGLAGQYPYLVATSPLDPDLVMVKTRQGIYRSFNGGQAWQSLDYGGGGYPRGDYLAIDPYTPTRVYLGSTTPCNADEFCLEISTDSGSTWEMVTSTLPITYPGWGNGGANAIAPHPLIPGRILVGSSLENPSNPDGTFGMVFASDDYGQSWQYLGPTEPISWIVDIAYDAVDPNLVYMATVGTGHWKSIDGGVTWEKMPYIGDGWIADEIVSHPTRSGHVVIGSEGIWGSQDAGKTWTQLSDSIRPPLAYVPTLPLTLYGKLESAQYRGLMRSFSDGQTWEQVDEAPYPVRLATATDGERVVLYIGSPGGMAGQIGGQASTNTIQRESSLFGGGVYRYTILRPDERVYLPLVLRQTP